ncbi:MAG: lmo0937 family membrane protein [Pyrinomonadaceae bacterium]
MSNGDKYGLQYFTLVLVLLWIIGMVTSNTFGGNLHLLLVLAAAIFLVQYFTGRRASRTGFGRR